MFTKNQGLKVRFGLLFLAVMLVFSSTIAILMYNIIKEEAATAALEKVKSDLAMGEALIDTWYPGPWRMEGDKLFKGKTLINDNIEVVDEIGRLTDDTVTIFLGNTRITTNVKNPDGTRAVGTTVSETVEKVVIQQGEVYYGEANVVGTLYQTGYKPIKDQQGNIIGIWYVGASKAFEEAMIKTSMNYILMASIALAALGILALIFFTNRMVIKPINSLVDCAERIAQGDLKVKVTDKMGGEFGRLAAAFNGMAASLQQVMQRMADYAHELSANSQELSAVAEEVSATMESVAATSAELTASAQQETQDASTAAAAATSVCEKAESAEQRGQQALAKIHTMQNTVLQGANAVQSLQDKSGQIEQIVVTIGGIADQTNLLALNAAIEAARAGEHGRGFAVVAEEVRKLAEESATATREITNIIQVIRQETDGAAEMMTAGVDEILDGVKLIESVGSDVNEIKEQSDTSTQLASQISRISEQNTLNIKGLSESTEQTSTAMQQVASSAQRLGQLAEDLNSVVSEYKL